MVQPDDVDIPAHSSSGGEGSSVGDAGSSSMDSRDASPVVEAPAASEADFARRTTAADARTYGCEHYKRKCKLLSPCCGEWFACRFCHDAVKHDDVAAGHQMDRHLVRRIQCMGCGTEQPPGASCITCGLTMGEYFCAHCNLFDDDTSKQQFHCDKCGICRVGAPSASGRDWERPCAGARAPGERACTRRGPSRSRDALRACGRWS